MSVPAVEAELRDLIGREGAIPFARFQEICLYSPRGGFYSGRQAAINAHFHTSPTSHPVFGALIAVQLEEMWRLLGEPGDFHVIEVGSGDGSLARSISAEVQETAPGFARALRYVASDYAPVWPSIRTPFAEHPGGASPTITARVKAEGLAPFRGITGCILSNELLDNVPVHRFEVRDGRILEVFVALDGGRFVERLAEPSTPRLAERLAMLAVSLPDGARGEMCLALDGWLDDVARALDRGFVLTIDYGGLASELYSEANPGGTLTCFREHMVGEDPYADIGEQDITAHVDFSSLMRLGEARGLTTVGYTRQADFLQGLGFAGHLEGIDSDDAPDARKELRRIAMMSLIDPEDTGDFRVLAQSKGLEPAPALRGFRDQLPR